LEEELAIVGIAGGRPTAMAEAAEEEAEGRTAAVTPALVFAGIPAVWMAPVVQSQVGLERLLTRYILSIQNTYNYLHALIECSLIEIVATMCAHLSA
jgi:hypothetical protein